jgi:hypothetical protein
MEGAGDPDSWEAECQESEDGWRPGSWKRLLLLLSTGNEVGRLVQVSYRGPGPTSERCGIAPSSNR